MGGIAFDLYRHKCKTCGKNFYGSAEWAYKARNKRKTFDYFCTYKCLRVYQKGREKSA